MCHVKNDKCLSFSLVTRSGILESFIFIILLKTFHTIRFCLPSKNDSKLNAVKMQFS